MPRLWEISGHYERPLSDTLLWVCVLTLGGQGMSRWPILRHIRWFYLYWQFTRWWLHVGRYHWLAPNPGDEIYLDDVWKGEA